MKKLIMTISTVATSILMAMSIQAAEICSRDSNKLDLYGKVNAKHYSSSNDANDGDTAYARLGFKGETQISDQLTGFGQWEYEPRGNHAESQDSSEDKTRLAFAGLKFGDYGSVDYGHNYGITYDTGAWADVLSEFSGDIWTQTDVFVTGHIIGVAIYRSNNFSGLVDGLSFAAQYRDKNDHTNITGVDGDGFDFSTTYKYEGFGVSATYAKSDCANDQAICGSNDLNASGQNVEVWAAGLKYNVSNIYLATTYSKIQSMTVFGSGHIASKAQDFGVVAQYQFDFGLRPSAAYLQSKEKDLGAWGNQDLAEYIGAGATYYFNKSMLTFVDCKISLIDKSDFTKASGITTDSIITAGLVYQF